MEREEEQNIKPMSPTEIAQQLQQEWLGGQGRITQLPGRAAPSTRKFYQTHKGYDFGVNAGTPIYAPYNLEVTGAGLSGGYGNRLAVYNPEKNQTAYLSHLSDIAVQPGSYQQGALLGYTGGVPGSYGAGNTTGAHLDIELYGGRQAFNPTGQAVTPQAQAQPNIQGYAQQLLERARQQYGGNFVGVTSDPNKFSGYDTNRYKVRRIAI